MSKKIEDGTRGQIASALPAAIEGALRSYQEFMEQKISTDSKEFKAHHDACKMAIAHIELLIKLAEWANLPDPKAEDEAQQTALQTALESARAEINQHKEKEDE